MHTELSFSIISFVMIKDILYSLAFLLILLFLHHYYLFLCYIFKVAFIDSQNKKAKLKMKSQIDYFYIYFPKIY